MRAAGNWAEMEHNSSDGNLQLQLELVFDCVGAIKKKKLFANNLSRQ